MKKILITLVILWNLPFLSVHAQDFALENGKTVSGTYAGEQDYNYYMVTPNQTGYLSIQAKTSDHAELAMDICNENREVVASDLMVADKETILHACEKGNVYYIRIRGKEGVNYQISCRTKKLSKLKYAKKYNYTFTNASLTSDHPVELTVTPKQSGIMHLMMNTNQNLQIQYCNKKGKSVSEPVEADGKTLTGIGVKKNTRYIITCSRTEESISGTTSIRSLKYQIDRISDRKYSTKSKAKTLTKNHYARVLFPAGKKTTAWFRVRITKKQKLTITLHSQMLQNNGDNLQLYICNFAGKKLNRSAIVINGQASATYKKKYIMKYPETVFGTTASFPEGTYYIKIVSKDKTSSGAVEIKWN